LRYSLRAYHDEKDLAPLIDILTRSQRLFGVTQNTSLDMLRVQFEHPTGWRPKQDVRIVEASDGVCAWSRTSWKDVPEGERVYTIELYLDPASYDSVLQRYLLDDAQERATEKALIHRKACGPQFFTVLVPDTDAATVDLLRSNGYVRIRQSVEMVRQPIDNLRPIGSLPLGLNERAVSDHDLPSIWRVERLARRGLWGEEPLTNAVYQRFVRMPLRDNSLFTVIWSGNNDVAHTLAFIDPEENEQNRYRRLSIWSTVVHPDYRRF
jgi:ribosomal protein S18 acetylase RimI-like enzyme